MGNESVLYSVYVKTDENGIVRAINSDAFMTSFDGWQKVSEGRDDRHHHSQNNYLDKPLINDAGSFTYKLVGGKVVERTEEEMDADVSADSPSAPSTDADARIAALEQQLEMLLEGVTADEEE